MTTNCLLHNTITCGKKNTVRRARSDKLVRIVLAYDWNTTTDNTALVYELVNEVIQEVKTEYPVKFSVESLGAKDGSIYCDICRQIKSSDIALFDISSYNLNVIFELGLAVGTGAYVFILRSRHQRHRIGVLSDLNGILEYRFSRRNGRLTFEADFRRSLKVKIRRAARRRIEQDEN